MSEINIDASLVRDGASLSRTEERLAEMTNGHICGTLRDDLLKEVDRLCKSGAFDYLLIESSGISEPMPVAATFAFAGDDGATLLDGALLDTMVTVVDALNLGHELATADALTNRALDQYEGDERTVADLLIDQIEFADVLLLNKSDLVDEATLDTLRATLLRLNPMAKVITTSHGKVDPSELLGTRLFDLQRAQQAPGWVDELNGDHVPETEEYGVSSLVFRAKRLFHPERLWQFVTEQMDSGAFGTVLRSKGFFTPASRIEVTGLWSQAGAVAQFEPQGSRVGDTDRQELVFIGTELKTAALCAALERCLLTDDEEASGLAVWRNYDDPFPAWEVCLTAAAHAH